MKVFFVFNIKDEFKSLYQDSASTLYKILKQIYYLDKEELIFGKTLFDQLINKIDKKNLDYELFVKMHQEMPYSKKGDVHYFNNLYKDEVSRLIVRKSYLKVETDSNFSTFFKVLSQYYKNLFICDFKTTEFFWLDQAKILV